MAYNNTSIEAGRRSANKGQRRDRRKNKSFEFRVFVSYAEGDKSVADETCRVLEDRGVRCWIAPRDIAPGMDYPTALFEALQKCSALILIFSRKSNDSPHVIREVELAVSRNILLIPVRIEDARPSAALSYFANSVHWLEALTPPLRQHLASVVTTLRIFRRKQIERQK